MGDRGVATKKKKKRDREHTARPEVTADTSLAPWIKPAIDPQQTRTIRKIPTFGIRIDSLLGGPVRFADDVTVNGWKEQRALAVIPVIVNETRHDRRPALRRAVLPVSEWLVTEKPIPLPVVGIGKGRVGVHGAAGVVGVEALHAAWVLPLGVAVAGAGAGEVSIVEPGGVAGQGGRETYTFSTGEGRVGRVALHAFDGVAPLVEAAALVELVGLP